jgi:hypothetical protein
MKIISKISAFASILAFLIPYFGTSENRINTSAFQFFCLGFFLIASIVVFTLEWFNRPKTFKNEHEIGEYMFNWISKTGRTVIYTRDMSWAKTAEIKNKLVEKAREKELILCMPYKTQFAIDLEKDGAEVYEYSDLDCNPQSRFTIVHYGRSDAKLAIGRTSKDGKHTITEFENGIHPQFHLAVDLVNILKKINS